MDEYIVSFSVFVRMADTSKELPDRVGPEGGHIQVRVMARNTLEAGLMAAERVGGEYMPVWPRERIGPMIDELAGRSCPEALAQGK